MQRILGRLGHQVCTASSCEEAIRVSSSPGEGKNNKNNNSFDILLCDLGLPDGNGYELLPRLRATQQSMRCIALSGYGREDDIQRSFQAGFVQHLTKPVCTAQVEEAIVAAMTGKEG
jgi:CheY-like chemotaxis protein